MSDPSARAFAAALVLLTASCGPKSTVPENPPVTAEPVQAPVAAPAAVPALAPLAASDPRLPVVGDPLGLLSKGAPPVSAPPGRRHPSEVDPGALMASSSLPAPTRVELPRDPRAMARAQVELPSTQHKSVGSATPSQGVQEKTAAEVIGGVRHAGTRPHVLFLYASYCKACRSAMPGFVALARSYQNRGVAFTAASVDSDRAAFTEYAPVLGGVLPAVWIKPEGVTRDELVRAGLKFEKDGYAIPLFAVFNGAHRVVSQGTSRELHSLQKTLDGLL